MKTNRIVCGLGAFALIAALSVMVYAKQEEKEEGEGKEKKIEMSQVPAPAKAAIEKAAAGAKIEKVTCETEDGKQVFEAKWAKDGVKSEVKVTADGQIAKEDEESEEGGGEQKIELSAAPAAVQAAVAKLIGSGKLTALTSEKEDGVALFEADYETANGSKDSAVMDAVGTIVEKEEQVKELPAAVKSALAKEFPGAKIGEAVAAIKTTYEVKVTVDGKEKEIKVSPAGQIEKASKEGKREKGEGKECKKGEKEGKHKEGKKGEKDDDDDDDKK